MKTQKILYFGKYQVDYSRNKINIEGLRQAGLIVNECLLNYSNIYSYIKCYFKLFEYYRLFKENDLIIVGFPARFDVIPARLLSWVCKKKLVYDAFFSWYDRYVNDFKSVKPKSIKAKLYYFVDKITCSLPNLIIVDTYQHVKYFHQKFGIKFNKLTKIYVGYYDKYFECGTKYNTPQKPYNILFYGNNVPLHGFKFILKAAKILESHKYIQFLLCGEHHRRPEIMRLYENLNLTNTKLLEPVRYSQLSELIDKAAICLGIFGNTPKARRVIPNKVFECMAMNKPVITRKSKAIKELFTHKINIYMCESANSFNLACSILDLIGDQELLKNISNSGFQLVRNNFSTRHIGLKLKSTLMKKEMLI
jgi:glycosyltransferase involved in cell wall biosynthesis